MKSRGGVMGAGKAAALLRALFAPVSANPYQGGAPLAYRPDVDGLRAVAVLGVVLYHAFPGLLPGGFLGVDIFFVISGYLISSIILRQLRAGAFSFTDFYCRRVRRIFPTLALALAACLAFGWFALLPEEYAALGKHSAGGAFFAANFLLWAESGYFDQAAHFKPLLHLWSLGIEEQFYLAFPLLLWAAARCRLRPLACIAALGLASFVCNLHLAAADRVADFYSPLARVWELLAGAALSALHASPAVPQAARPSPSPALAVFLALAGLAALALGLVLASHTAAWPAWRALLPVLGAALLIAAGPANPINKYLLANRLMVFVGLISYPLYLWHWPLLSFAHILTGGLAANTRLLRLGLVGAAFVLAALTWLWVERPLRFARKQLRPYIIAGLLAAMLAVGLTGLGVWRQQGFPARVGDAPPALVQTLEAQTALAQQRGQELFPDWADLNDHTCKLQRPLSQTTVALIGDSHADHLFAGLLRAMGAKGGLAAFPASGAAPYLDIASFTRAGADYRKNGTFLLNRAYAAIMRTPSIKNVVLAHNPQCSFDDIIDKQDEKLTDRDVILENGMRRTFAALTAAGKNIVLVLDNPTLPFDPRVCRQRPLELFTSAGQCRFKRELFDQDQAQNWYKRILFHVLKDYPRIRVVDLSSVLCDDVYCYGAKNGVILYRDKDHLSFPGSLLVAPLVQRALQ